ncbi:MAG: acetate--CoA ligase family protein [Prochloraceae cyanobacterium]|nr:acetate--CoA ligase family protein [Prochloraceae cyanobacterium]
MDLLEYQAKELFSKVGIPILPSQPIADPRQIKKLQIPYPVVLKSQVRAGGRGKAGGIRFVENTIDAIAAAQYIFNLPILGQYPNVILAEARYNAKEEFFLAIVLDYQLKRPVLLGSAKGGVEIEPLLENIQKVVVEADFSPFYARRLVTKMGLRGKLIQSVSAIVEKMYRLFVEKDLDIIEINPLGVGVDGEVMALDGKITINSNALVRHPDLYSLQRANNNFTNDSQSLSALPSPQWLDYQDESGNIAIVCNSLGLALVTWDLIVRDGGKPRGSLVIDRATKSELLPHYYIARSLNTALEKLSEVSGIKAVLINILGNEEITGSATNAIVDYLQLLQQKAAVKQLAIEEGSLDGSDLGSEPEPLQWIIRIVGGKKDFPEATFTEMPVRWIDDLEEAVSQTISLAKIE